MRDALPDPRGHLVWETRGLLAWQLKLQSFGRFLLLLYISHVPVDGISSKLLREGCRKRRRLSSGRAGQEVLLVEIISVSPPLT